MHTLSIRQPVDATTTRANAVAEFLAQVARDYAPAVFASSLGAEDMVLTDMILTRALPIAIFTLDTGRLPEATHALIAEIEQRYATRIGIVHPQPDALALQVMTWGNNGFYDSLQARRSCCQARKVEPLRRALAGKQAWITGLRAAQSPTRAGLTRMTWDETHELVKFSPLADWTDDDVWAYLRAHDVPVNRLHAEGYPSIGCAPCTRAIQPGEDPRAGRWWWEAPTQRECGLHVVDGRLRRVANYSGGGTAVAVPRAAQEALA